MLIIIKLVYIFNLYVQLLELDVYKSKIKCTIADKNKWYIWVIVMKYNVDGLKNDYANNTITYIYTIWNELM